MRYADYYDCDICNGKSVGMSLFVSGCPFHCRGCFNPETWDFNYGKDWTPEIEDKFLELVGRDYIKRVSFLGGSPLCNENVGDVARIIQRIRKLYPEKQIWVYTGYTWEEIFGIEDTIYSKARHFVLNYVDVLVDGPFEDNRKDLTLAFRGSNNQRIIDVKKSLEKNEIVLYDGEV